MLLMRNKVLSVFVDGGKGRTKRLRRALGRAGPNEEEGEQQTNVIRGHICVRISNNKFNVTGQQMFCEVFIRSCHPKSGRTV